MGWQIGIDEAGRGPVFGAMFVVAAGVPDTAELPDGVDDSKRLDADTRERLGTALRQIEALQATTVRIDPEAIDANPGGLNELTVQAQADAAKAVLETCNGATTVIADACDTNPERARAALRSELPNAETVIAEHGADERRPIVAAASILAKCAREAHVQDLADRYGSFGSGYPSDRRTRAFLARYLEEHEELPPFARRSWKTSEEALAAAEQRSLDTFSDSPT